MCRFPVYFLCLKTVLNFLKGSLFPLPFCLIFRYNESGKQCTFVLAADRNRTKGDANEMKLRPWKQALSLVLAFALVFAMPCVTSVYADDIPLYYLDSGGEVKEVPETTQLLDTGASVWGSEGTETWYYKKMILFWPRTASNRMLLLREMSISFWTIVRHTILLPT